MKKIFGFLLMAAVLFGNSNPASAQDGILYPEDVLSTSSELEEISALEDEMVDAIAGNSGGTAHSVEFHYERSVKIHGTDIFQLNTDDAEILLQTLEKGDHMWIVEAEMNGKWYRLEIPKGMPLNEDVDFSPEEEREIREHEGKWFVVGVGEITEEDQSLWNRVMAQEKTLENCDQAVIIHDLPGFQFPVLLGMENGKASVFAGLGYDYAIVDDYEEMQTVQSEQESVHNSLYSFQEMADRAEQYRNVSLDESGGAGRKLGKEGWVLLWIPVAALIVLAIAAAYRIRRKPA